MSTSSFMRSCQRHFAFLRTPGSVAQRLQNIFMFEIWVISQNVLDAVPSPNLTYNHANGHTHPTNACFAFHNIKLLGDAIYGLNPFNRTL